MTVLVKALTQYTFTEEFYDSDTLLSVCTCCGKKAWLIKDIDHKKGCQIADAFKIATILDNGTKETVVKRLKVKICSIAKELKKRNYHGAKYHIKEIDEIVEELLELSKALQ